MSPMDTDSMELELRFSLHRFELDDDKTYWYFALVTKIAGDTESKQIHQGTGEGARPGIASIQAFTNLMKSIFAEEATLDSMPGPEQ